MKLALITDIHFGGRNNNVSLSETQETFYKDIFFPYIDEHNITRIINLGDTFEDRKKTNTDILDRSKRFFFDEIRKRNIIMDVVVGNHDSFYKNTNDVNTPDSLLKEYKFNVYSKPIDIEIAGRNFAMLPWINSENYSESIEFLNTSKSTILFGHLELSGFDMYRGVPNHHGMSTTLFKRFDRVYSGHFHTRSTKGNITYLGAPYEMNWNDWDDPRGFHIFDTDTNELEFIENPNKSFHKIKYDDSDLENISNIDCSNLNNTYVKLYIVHKDNQIIYDKFLEKLDNSGVLDVQVIDNRIKDLTTTVESSIGDVDDTRSMLKDVIHTLEVDLDKQQLSSFIDELYNEAISL